MKLSSKGIALIKGFENCKLHAYLDTHVPPIWTIGWGHTGPEVHAGLIWDQPTADATFIKDAEHREAVVTQAVLAPLTQNQFDALVSLLYNIGESAFRNSTLLRLLNKLDYMRAAKQFLIWNHSGGKVSQGLTNRRKAEKQIFEADTTLKILAESSAIKPRVK